MNIGQQIANRRKLLGLTQRNLADVLHVSFQAISKWENGTTFPDVTLLAPLARVLRTSVDALVDHRPALTDYEQRYQGENYYWGLKPNDLCYEIMKRRPPERLYRVLDIGCGEGKDAVFLARSGYAVTAFDAAKAGVEKARQLAELHNVPVDFFQADVLTYVPEGMYDIVFCSGVLHYLPPEQREKVLGRLKEHTSPHGLHVMNVFVSKPFIAPPPDVEPAETAHAPWKSGELFVHYHDWMLLRTGEVIFDCKSSGIPHQHCMDIMIAEKMTP